MSIPARWGILLAFAFLECSSSNVNDEQTSDGSGSIGGGGNSGSGGNAGSISGGASGVGAVAGEADSGGAGPNTCSGSALECVTCCEANHPDGYAEFFAEFKISQCSGQACAGTCGAVCSGSSVSVTPTCAECFFLNEPNVNEQVGLACKLSAHVECEAFVSCLEACRLE